MEGALKAMGLDDKELDVYLANLKLGSSSAQEIANFAKVNRTSAYDILASLEEKGFASYTVIGKKRVYQAVSPKNLLGLLKEKEILLKRALPDLTKLEKSIKEHPAVRVFIGKKSLKMLLEDILRSATTTRTISSRENMDKIFKHHFPNFVRRRMEKGTKRRLIMDGLPIDTETEYKTLKKKIKTSTWIYGNRIVTFSLEENEPIGIVIEDKNFADTYKLMFDIMWDAL